MGRIVEPPAPDAFEVKAHSGVYEDGRLGFAFGQFGKEIKELVILRDLEPEGTPYFFPPTAFHVRQDDLFIKQYDFRATAGTHDILESQVLNILGFDLTAKVLANAIQLEDLTYLELEDGQLILLEQPDE